MNEKLDAAAFAIFSVWHAGSSAQARASWEGMSTEMRAVWYRCASAASAANQA